MFKPGMTVKVFGKSLAIVTSVHKGGKRLGITYVESGRATFVSGSAATAVA